MSADSRQSGVSAMRSRPAYWRDLRTAWFWILLVLAIVVTWYCSSPQRGRVEALGEGTYQVRRVVDGDTLLLADGARVRLEGIDTPETVKVDTPVEPWGPEASQFAKDFVERAGGQVRLTFPLERRD